MAREAALVAWLRAVTSCSAPDLSLYEDGHELLELVRQAAPALVPAAGADTPTGLDAVLAAAGTFFGVEVTYSDAGSCGSKVLFAAEVVLGVCVQGDAKHDAVAAITALDEEHHAPLAAAIQEVMQRYCGGDDGGDAGPASPVVSIASSVRTPASRQRGTHARTPGTVAALRHQVASLQAQLAAATHDTAADADAERMRKQHTTFMEAEMASMRERSEREAEVAAQLAAKDATIATLQTQVGRLTDDAAGMAEMRDELDVLRPLTTAVAKAEALNRKYQQQLEVLDGVQAEVAELRGQNTKLVATNVRLQADTDRLTKTEAQLAECRAAKAAAQVRVSDLESDAAEADKQLQRLRDQLATLKRGAVQAEAAAAAARAAAVAMGDGGGMGPSAVGCGLSELNPEMMETMARLEAENQRLTAEVSDAANARVAGLEAQLEDVTQLKATVESQWAKEKDARSAAVQRAEGAEDEVARLTALLAEETKALVVASKRADNAEAVCRDVKAKWQAEHELHTAAVARGDKAEAALAALRVEHDTLVHRAQTEYKAAMAKLKQRLAAAEASWDEEKSASSLLRSQLADLQARMKTAEAAKRAEATRTDEEATVIARLSAAVTAKADTVKQLEAKVAALESRLAARAAATASVPSSGGSAAAPPAAPSTRRPLTRAAAARAAKQKKATVVADGDSRYADGLAKLNAQLKLTEEREQSALLRESEAVRRRNEVLKANDALEEQVKGLKADVTRLELQLFRAGQDPDDAATATCATCAAQTKKLAAPSASSAPAPAAAPRSKASGGVASAAAPSLSSGTAAPKQPFDVAVDDEFASGGFGSSVATLNAKLAAPSATGRVPRFTAKQRKSVYGQRQPLASNRPVRGAPQRLSILGR